MIQLSSGRLLVPVAYTPNVWMLSNLTSFCFYSDDNGRTWFNPHALMIYIQGRTEVSLPNATAEEPGLVELKDGRVTMILRTNLGYVYKAYSQDGGLTWTEPESMGLVSPRAPATIKRIPTTGDLLMVWNNTPGPRRVPLTTTISRDEGEKWENSRNLETDERYTYAYPSVTFLGEEALLTYYVYDEKTRLISLKLKRIPIQWFYKKDPEALKHTMGAVTKTDAV